MLGDGLLLFLTAMAQEDIAILTAGYLILERGMPPAVALAAVYAGALLGNLGIYGLGAAAHRWRWTERWHIGERVARVRERLLRHWVPTVLLCRLTPGLLWPTLLGCGWLGVPFARFAAISAVAAMIYVPLMLALIVTFGEALPREPDAWRWVMLLAFIAIAAIVVARRRARSHRR